jgi:hypothetical protein
MRHAAATLRAVENTRIAQVGLALALVGSVVACAPPPPTAPTVQAAATGAVSTVQSQATQVLAPTVSAAQAQVAGVQTQVAPTVSSAQTQVAPTVASAQTQVAPTVAAAQTQVAPTVAAAQAAVAPTLVAAQATATALAPTAQAVATHVAPTVVAAATSTVGAFATQVAQSTMQVTNVTIDSADSSVTVKNSGDRSENLRDWTLVMGPVFAVQLGDIDVPAGQSVKLHFAVGASTPTDVYLGFGSNAVSNNLKPGMRVVLVAPRDQIASVYPL